MKQKITACIIAKNEEAKIGRCLKSLVWCDELVVVDSFSSDRTVEIARTFTCRVFQREWAGYAAQKEFAWAQASNEWIFWVDADEEVPASLQDEITRRFESGDLPNGFEMPRMVRYLGRWIRHGNWYPDVKLRLFRRGAVRIAGRQIHEKAEVDGPVEKLKSPLFHYTYDSLADQISTIVRFSALSAEEKFHDGKRCRWTDLFFRPANMFVRGYFFKLGFLDGMRGLMIAVMNAVDTALKYARLYELQATARATKEAKDL